MTVAQGKPRTILSPRGLVLLLLIGGLMFSSVYPMRRYFTVRDTIASLRSEQRVLEQRIDELTAERARLRSDAEVERLAREQLGMVRPGEVPFVIATPKPGVQAPAVDPGGLAPPAPRDTPTAIERWWHAVRSAAGAG